jgi:molybdopterin synthase catalytic subunit
VPRIEIVTGPIAVERPLGVAEPTCGAVVEFQGIVRGTEDGVAIRALEYECHEAMARTQLMKIAEDAAIVHGLKDITIIHRIGTVATGETSLYVRTVAPHRREAFAAAMMVVDRIKLDVPIWKHPIRAAKGEA